MRPLPPIRALQAFVAVARTGSLSAAATALGMSAPALSRRLQLLELDIGAALLQRLPRGTILTPAGERYYKLIEPALEAIRIATADFKPTTGRPVVRVSITSAIARTWLIPRLPAFGSIQPEVDVELHLSPELVSLESGEYDVAIRLCDPTGLSGLYKVLFPVTLFPVSAPGLAVELRDPKGLRRTQIIGPDRRREFWPEWCRGVGLGLIELPPIRYVDSELLYESAATGMAVAIGIDPLVRPFLSEGRLIRAIDATVTSSRSFYLLHAATPGRAVRAFCAWLENEAAESADAWPHV